MEQTQSIAEMEVRIRALRERLRSDPDPTVRRNAVFDLDRIGIEPAIDDLIAALHDVHGDVRTAALQVLSDSGMKDDHPRMVDAFIRCLSDPDAEVRKQAAAALRYSMARAIPALIGALQDPTPDVRVEALLALGSLEAEEAIDAMAARLHHDPDEEVRAYAAVALEDLRSPGVADHLIKALDDASARIRSRAVRALAEASAERHQSVVRALCRALRDADDDVRASAATSLERVLDDGPTPDWEAALAPLCAAVHDPHAEVRAAVVAALGLSRDARALAALVLALEDDDDEVKAQALQSIGGIDSSLCLAHVPRLLASPNVTLQRAAISALNQARDVPIPRAVLTYFADDTADACAREAIADLIAERGDPVHVPNLLNALSTGIGFLRCTVVKALCDLPDPRATQSLMQCLNDEDDEIRAHAALALAAIGDERAIQPLHALTQDDASYVRRRAIWALSFFDLSKVQAQLVRALEDPDEHVQSAAADALAEVCDARTLRRIRSTLPRTQAAIGQRLEAAAAVLDQTWGGACSGEPRSIHLGTIHYE